MDNIGRMTEEQRLAAYAELTVRVALNVRAGQRLLIVGPLMNGGVSRIRPGQPATLIATNIPNAASMCYDAGANQLVIPMNPNKGLAFVPAKESRQEFEAYIALENLKWKKIVEDAGVKIE